RIRGNTMQRHQSPQRGAVFVEVTLLDALCLGELDLQQPRYKRADPLMNLVEQPAARRIERVVEIKDPAIDMTETSLHTPDLDTRVPTPCGVKSSSSTLCGTRPSRMITPSTPDSTTAAQLSTFGIMPPEIVPSAISAGMSASVSSEISSPLPSSTPATSVRSKSRLALSAVAIAPAAVPALTLDR